MLILWSYSKTGCNCYLTGPSVTSHVAEPNPSSNSDASSLSLPKGGTNEIVRNFYAGRFKSTFVSSGTTGFDAGSGATIIAPKSAQNKPVPAPPVPVTARPPFMLQPNSQQRFTPAVKSNFVAGHQSTSLSLNELAGPHVGQPAPRRYDSYAGLTSSSDASFDHRHRGSHKTPSGSYNNQPPPEQLQTPATYGSKALQSDAAKNAIAAAQAIAARLSQDSVAAQSTVRPLVPQPNSSLKSDTINMPDRTSFTTARRRWDQK